MHRIGLGYDIHQLVEGRRLFLGGVEIPHTKGLKGHSDGDCLIHAVIDALLGAVGGKDIGRHFPDTDARYKDIRSTRLLEFVARMFLEKNASIINLDTFVVAQEPVLAPYVPKMQRVMSNILGIGPETVGIKPKTNEGLGAIGQGEAVAAMAVVLVDTG